MRRMILLAMLFTVAALRLHAQPLEPCTPDCFDTPWEPSLIGHFTDIRCGSHLCRVGIWYRKRRACDGKYQDIHLVGIEKDRNNPGCEDSCSVEDIIRECTRKMLLDNPMRFDPLYPGTCAVNWRISTATCWNRDEMLFQHPAMLSCSPSCCMAMYRVCLDSGLYRSYVMIGTEAPAPYVCSSPCVIACGGIELPDYFPKSSRLEAPSAGGAGVSASSGAPIPNPARWSTSLPVSLPHPGVVIAFLRDVSGVTVRRVESELNGVVGTIPLDLSGLSNGAYFYSIEQDGRIIATGGLTIAW